MISSLTEKFPQVTERVSVPGTTAPWAGGRTLYDLLGMLSLHSFQEYLQEAGLLELLKHPSEITVIAPIDEAFNAIPSLISFDDGSAQALQTLMRTHIVLNPSLFREPIGNSAVEGNYDMNGNQLALDVTITPNSEVTDKKPVY